MIRLFVAVDPSEEVATKIEEFVAEACSSEGVRRVPRRNYHLTMRFLGDLPQSSAEGRVREILEVLRGIAKTETAFQIYFRGLGAFSSRSKHPQILWVGVAGSPNRLANRSENRLALLAEKLDSALATIGFEPERRDFVPHLTVAKVGRFGALPAKWAEQAGCVDESDRSFGPSEVRELILYRSRILSEGAAYEALGRFPFKG